LYVFACTLFLSFFSSFNMTRFTFVWTLQAVTLL